MNQIKETLKEEEARKIIENIKESGDLMFAEELIKDNQIEFTIQDKTYRVRLLNLREKEELDTLRRKKFGQLIQDLDILLEKDLIQVYKNRGINILDMDEKLKKLDTEILDKRLSLGESIANNEGEEILKTYHEQIEKLELEKQILFIQKNTLLEFSLENQILLYVSQIISYLSTDIKINGEWKRLWNTIEEFLNCNDEMLINKVASLTMLLQYNF